MKIVVIGAVAAGMSAASQAKRRMPESEVVVFERGAHVSYGACGMPYNLEDPAREMDDLVVISAEQFREKRGIDVRIRHEVKAIDTEKKQVQVLSLEDGREFSENYDRLVIATGASPFLPPIEGLGLPGVFPLRTLQDGFSIKSFLQEQRPKKAVVIGGGYIGLELADVMTTLGVELTLVERLPQLAFGFHGDISSLIQKELEDAGVRVLLDTGVQAIREGESGGLQVELPEETIMADLVFVATGVRPNSAIAEAAGIALGAGGAIAVDAQQRTNIPDVFAAGDCAEALHLVSGEGAYIPLGTTANKQGKVAGANVVGADLRFGGIVGTAGFKVRTLEVARTGLGPLDMERLGLEAVEAVSKQSSVAHGYPGNVKITTVVYAEKGTGRLLGAQMVGASTVAKRIDVFATALHAGMTMEQIEALDLSYAPPFAPVYDPILIAATVTKKVLSRS